MNHYVQLGLPGNATADEIRAAYFEAARRFHPDANPDPQAKEMFIQKQTAYEVLSNPEARAAYDASLPAKDLTPPAISIHTALSRNSLPRLDEPQLIYALLDITSVPDPSEEKTSPINLCLVLDRSTSMQGARMDMVKSNALQLIKQMKPQDIISVVAFSDRAEVIVPATHIADRNRIEARISALQTGGGTEILYGLQQGLKELGRNRHAQYISHLILLTDGRTYGDEEKCLELARIAAENGIGISGLGIGHEWNDAFLDELAGVSGGGSMFISAPKDLHQYLEQKCSRLGKVYAEKMQLDFVSDPAVEVRYAFRLMPEVGPLPLGSPIPLGSISQYNRLSILVEFLVKETPPQLHELNLATGSIRMEISSRNIPVTKLPLQMAVPVSETARIETPPQTIVKALSKLSLYRLQEKARAEVERGEINQAARHLHYLATQLLSQGERELAHTVLVETEHVHQNQTYSKEGDKRIKYGTRALLLPPGPEGNHS